MGHNRPLGNEYGHVASAAISCRVKRSPAGRGVGCECVLKVWAGCGWAGEERGGAVVVGVHVFLL